MKTHVSLLAVCLLGTGLVTAQTTTNTSSTTTTSATYGTTPTTTADSSTASGRSNSNATMGTGTTNSSGTTTNSMASPSYGTTTTTTTTSNNTPTTTGDVNMGKSNDKALGDKDGKFGVYAGVNFSRFVNEPIPDGAFRAGYQIGVYGRSAGTIFGQIGLEYRTSTSNLVRNGTGQPTQPAGQIRGQIDQQFVAIPAYVGVRVGSALGLRLQAGAELSTLIRHPNNQFGINDDDIRRTILGGLLGAGINLGPLTLDAVYNIGLQNVFEGADTKRRLIAVNLGFRF